MGRLAFGRKKLLFPVLILLFGLLIHFNSDFILGQGSRIIILWPNPERSQPNLQLHTFPYITIPPGFGTPEDSDQPNPGLPGSGTPFGDDFCPLDDVRPSESACRCLDFLSVACPAPGSPPTTCPAGSTGMPTFVMQLPPGRGSWYCIDLLEPGLNAKEIPVPPDGCFLACIAKPVVYLYPTEPTYVSVSVEAPGDVFISDPPYPEGGWKNVLAYPDGELWYDGRQYTELFYETSVNKKISMPATGIVIPRLEIEEALTSATHKLGLVGREQKDFLDFWVPLLRSKESPYIFFSILPPDVKDSVDRLIIDPEPDTRIEFIAYFKALDRPIVVGPLKLPDTPIERVGFTMVEWGGTIGH